MGNDCCKTKMTGSKTEPTYNNQQEYTKKHPDVKNYNPYCGKTLSGKQINELFAWNKTFFFKFVKRSKQHYGYTYKLGLNIDSLQFNPSSFCSPGGLYFADKSNIYTYKDFGDDIAIIRLLNDSNVYIEESKYKADCLYICGYISAGSLQYLTMENIYQIMLQNKLITVAHFDMFPSDIQYYAHNATQEMWAHALKKDGTLLRYRNIV